MTLLPMRGYKRKPFPTLDTDDEGIKQFIVDEFQRLENTLETHKQAVDVTVTENEVVKTSVSNLSATVDTNTADITSEQTARASADEALATDITSLTATVTSNNSTLSSAITSEQTARTDADTALATSITTLEATVGDNTSAITVEATTRASADTELETSVNAAIADAASAQSTADGKIETFYQDEEPSSGSLGDLWFDTDDKNKLYRYDGTSWSAARDSDIATAITDAAGAQATADGKVTTFYQDDSPTAEGIGDLWVDTNDGNKLYRWDGSNWLSVQDTTIPALEAKYGVKLNVNGYITGFEQNNDGTTGSFKILADEFKIIDPAASSGDEGTEVFGISGGEVTMQNVNIGTAVIDDLAVTSAKIGNLQVTSGKIGSSAVDTDKISDLAVDTLKIADRAVTLPNSAFTSSEISVDDNDGLVTIQTVSYTTTGSPVNISASCYYYGDDDDSTSGDVQLRFRILRNGTLIGAITPIDIFRFDSNGQKTIYPFSISVKDTPASGTVTYTFVADVPSISANPNCKIGNRSLVTLEVKK